MRLDPSTNSQSQDIDRLPPPVHERGHRSVHPGAPPASSATLAVMPVRARLPAKYCPTCRCVDRRAARPGDVRNPDPPEPLLDPLSYQRRHTAGDPRTTREPVRRDAGPRWERVPAESDPLRVVPPPLPGCGELRVGQIPSGMRRSTEEGAKVPVGHGDLGDEDRQDEHRHVGGRRSRSGRPGHVEDQGNHSHEGSEDRLPRKEPRDPRRPVTVDTNVNGTDHSPCHRAIVPKASLGCNWPSPSQRASLLSQRLGSPYRIHKTALTAASSWWPHRDGPGSLRRKHEQTTIDN